MFERYYNILGLEPGASDSQIKKAFKKKAKKFHPDLNDSPDAHRMFVEIQEAHDVLLKKKPVATISFQQPDPEVVRRREEKRRFRERMREMKRNARKRALRDYLRFRGSVYFTIARFMYLFLLFTGIVFVVAPLVVFFMIRDRGILIALFSVPIGIHIINVTYQHYRNLYPPHESNRFLIEKFLEKHVKPHDPVLMRGFIALSLISTMIVFCLITRTGAEATIAAIISPMPMLFSVFLYKGSKNIFRRKTSDEGKI